MIDGEKISIHVKVNNYGNYNAKNFTIEYSAHKDGELVFSDHQDVEFLSDGDSIILASKEFSIVDTTIISASLEYSKDVDQWNNSAYSTIIPGFNEKTVLINEIMFKPADDMPEWIEIINNSDSIINLSSWVIGDLKEESIITDEQLSLDPNSFVVISNIGSEIHFDPHINYMEMDLPNLSNTKDAVVIRDFRGALIDSVNYDVGSNFSIGKSIERISLQNESNIQSNWMFSLDQNGSTPGEINSVATVPNYQFGDVIISEIMFDPSDLNCEFIELINKSGNDIEIGGWNLVDRNNDPLTIMNDSYIFDEDGYFVVAADSSILLNYDWLKNNEKINILNTSSLVLTNVGKQIYLTDIYNSIIDSIHYQDSWHNGALMQTKNISLEVINTDIDRNNSDNWSSSVHGLGATPGIKNSINIENLVSSAKIEINPNPFSPDNDGFEDFTIINYNLSQPISQIKLRIFDSKGRYRRTIVNGAPSGSNGSIIFDGLDDNGNPLKIGIYIVLLEAVNNNNSVVDVVKDVVVVARKL